MTQNKSIISVTSFFIFSLSLAHAQVNDTIRSKLDHLKTAFKTIDNSYPKTRYFGAGISLVFGGLSDLKGISILDDDQATDSEKIMAYALLGIGSTRMVDALYSFFSSTSIEKDPTKFQGMKDSQQKVEFGETKLKQAAKHGKFMRYFRTFLEGGTSAAYLYLYNLDSKEYDMQIYIGIALAGVTAYKLLSRSPEEKAWNHYKNTVGKEKIGKLNYYFSPFPKGFIAGVYLKF